MALIRLLPLAVLGLAATGATVAAQGATAPTSPQAPLAGQPPAPAFKPEDSPPPPPSDVWIFSGVLEASQESFSGTLVSGKADTQFELRLADGASCDGNDLAGDIGLVRLSEIACTDGRSMRALFVPQGGRMLKVFGHVGDERFAASAHLLGNEAVPEPAQTAQPTVPQVQPPGPPHATPAPQKPGGK